MKPVFWFENLIDALRNEFTEFSVDHVGFYSLKITVKEKDITKAKQIAEIKIPMMYAWNVVAKEGECTS